MLNAQQYAQEVSNEMLRLRGWGPSTATAEVRNDVFHTLDRHADIYSRGFSAQLAPTVVAQNVQNAEWGSR